MAFTLSNNAYYKGLTNLALFVKMYYLRDGEKSQQFVDAFTTESLRFGDAKVFRTTPLPSVENYSGTSSLLTDHTPSFEYNGETYNVIEEVLKITNKKVIPSSYSREDLYMAVTSDEGANIFIAQTYANMEAAKTDFLYDVIVNDLFSYGYPKRETVHLFDTSTATTAVDLNTMELINQKEITLAIQKTIESVLHFTTAFNKYGLKQSIKLSDLRMIVCQPYKNQGVINLFAELLNSQFISENMPKPELLTIPEIKIPANARHVVAFIMHKEFYQLFYKYVFQGNFFDVSNLRVNDFLHFSYGKGKLDHLPAAVILSSKDRTLAPTPTEASES